MKGKAMVGWGDKSQANTQARTDPRARCWVKPSIANDSARKKQYLIDMFKLYRPIIPVSNKTSFTHNLRCTEKLCVNPFHYSAKGGC